MDQTSKLAGQWAQEAVLTGDSALPQAENSPFAVPTPLAASYRSRLPLCCSETEVLERVQTVFDAPQWLVAAC